MGSPDAAELQQEKDRLEDSLVKLNMDMKDKNEKILELLEELQEVKVQVYAGEKNVELQQMQVEELLEELREAKAVENDIKMLVSKKIAIEEENIRLRKDLDEKMM